MVTQDRLKELMDYDPLTGIFTRKKRTAMRQKIGEAVGVEMKKGYLKCGIDNKEYFMHRLAWLFMTGDIPNMVDHINQDKKDNRFSNLRSVTNSQNLRNMSRSKRNTSGFTGVSYSNNYQQWVAQIHANGKRMLKRFDLKFDAIECRKAWNKEYRFHKNHGMEKG